MTEAPRIQVAAPELDGSEARYVNECLETNWISSAGRFITEFEQRFAEFCGTRHAIATCNGTVAVHLALTALGVGPGDEVIVPTMTFVATANAVRYCGATPILVDSEPVGYTIDADAVRRAITPRTKAIVPVHLYGHAADMATLNSIAAEHEIPIIEDAAEAHGARVAGRRVGGLGTCAAFSFFGNKIITTGEGGAVTTDDDDLAARLRLLRGQGMDPGRRYWFPIVGFNYRMTNIAAAIGLGQLEGASAKLRRRAEIAARYHDRLAGTDVGLPTAPPWSSSVDWLYTVRLPVKTDAGRDAVIEGLDAVGIETRPVFYPMHQLPPYLDTVGHYPVADVFGATGISLPTHTRLSDADVDRVCEQLSIQLHAV